MNSIKEYMDYRDYLSDFYEDKKKNNQFFSYRYMSGKLSIDASHLFKIFQKNRHIRTSLIDVFINFCNLKGVDAEYFSALVHFNKSKSDRDSKFYFEKLLALKGVNAYSLEKNQYEYFTRWYYAAICTLLDFFPFKDDYKQLASKLSPRITEEQARQAITLLESLDLIRKNDGGTCYLTHKIISTGEQCRTIAVKTFQEETIRLAAESLHRHQKEERNISSVTVTVSSGNMENINALIKEFRETLLRLAESETTPNRVYQLNIQFFPLSEEIV